MEERVYFIATEGLRFVKIGFSKDPHSRWTQIKVGTPQRSFLLGSFPGGRTAEKLLHIFFEDLRTRQGSEWFELRGSLHAYLEMKGILKPVYGAYGEKARVAKVIRCAGWDVFSHDDLDRILSEPEIAWDVYYSCCRVGNLMKTKKVSSSLRTGKVQDEQG